MDYNLESLKEIEVGLRNFDFIETNNPQIPVMGRVIIGTAVEPSDPANWKMIVLEIGLESSEDKYEWYWELSLSDDSSTEVVSKNHNSGFKTDYKPSCKSCTIIPMKFHGDTLEDFSKQVIEDIRKNFIK